MTMRYIKFLHEKKSDYSAGFTIKNPLKETDSNFGTLLSFDDLVGVEKTASRVVAADSRFFDIVDDEAADIALVNVLSRSPLAPILIWDLAHYMAVGQSIAIFETTPIEVPPCVLESDYYKSSFELIQEVGFRRYKKIKPLVIEKDAGLDNWSFCIPVGPENAVFLNAVVKRILELDIPNKEILLCGTPGENFKYFTDVRLVGEDIKAPPVHITRKKNRLVDEARYENICMLHDRVFLPLNFLEAMKKGGDFFPFTAFHSLYFFDRHNCHFIRYSDYGVSVAGFQPLFDKDNSIFYKNNFQELEKFGDFAYAHASRYKHGENYLTGSLYICKKSLWQFCPQNEALYWAEFEDIEHSCRAAQKGIPSTLNPYSFTQSINARPLLMACGTSGYETSQGTKKGRRYLFDLIPFLQRKPLLKVTPAEAQANILKFVEKYHLTKLRLPTHKLEGRFAFIPRTKIMVNVMLKMKLTRKKSFARQLYQDVCKHLILEQVLSSEEERFITYVGDFKKSNRKAKLCLIGGMNFFMLQNAMSLFHNPFMVSTKSYFCREGQLLKWVTRLTAWRLTKSDHIRINLSRDEIYQTLLDTTPTVKYYED